MSWPVERVKACDIKVGDLLLGGVADADPAPRYYQVTKVVLVRGTRKMRVHIGRQGVVTVSRNDPVLRRKADAS